jgi:hypothetical protein
LPQIHATHCVFPNYPGFENFGLFFFTFVIGTKGLFLDQIKEILQYDIKNLELCFGYGYEYVHGKIVNVYFVFLIVKLLDVSVVNNAG